MIRLYIVLAQQTQRVKIGIASDVTERINRLACMNADDLETLAVLVPQEETALEMETRIHRDLKAYKVHPERKDNEWFEYNQEVQDYIEALKAECTS
jgi:Meiotically up-regulated gene 113